MFKVNNVVKVGIADLNTTSGEVEIRTSGLGSCVGVVVYDLTKQVAGLAHVMLPDSNLTKQTNFNVYKYADTALDELVIQLEALGARKYALKAKIAGGAQMFQMTTNSDVMRIGPRNIDAVKEKLSELRIPIIASDIGGNKGRTIQFNPVTGKLKIRTVNEGETYI